MNFPRYSDESFRADKHGRVIGNHGGRSPFGYTEDNIAADFFSGLDDPVCGRAGNGLRSEIPVIPSVFRIAFANISANGKLGENNEVRMLVLKRENFVNMILNISFLFIYRISFRLYTNNLKIFFHMANLQCLFDKYRT